MPDLDRAERLIQEGSDLVMRPPVQDDGRLDQIVAELASLLYCENCRVGDFADCKHRVTRARKNRIGQTHKSVLRPPCPMLGWHGLLTEARKRG